MLVPIPDSLRDKFMPLRDDFGGAVNDYGVVRTQMENGGARQEVQTLPYYQGNYSMSIVLTGSELTEFRRWLYDDLAGGSKAFLLSYRLTPRLLLNEARFVIGESFQIRSIGVDVWRVSFVLECREEDASEVLPADIIDLLDSITYEEFGDILDLLARACVAVKAAKVHTDNAMGAF